MKDRSSSSPATSRSSIGRCRRCSPDGRTALYDAVIAGLDRLDEGSRARKVLIVISDGGDNASRATLDQVLERARRSDATIYTIGLFEPGDRDANPGVLKSLARDDRRRALPAGARRVRCSLACRRIARDIRSGYTIAFEPSKRDGKYHHVQVESTDQTAAASRCARDRATSPRRRAETMTTAHFLRWLERTLLAIGLGFGDLVRRRAARRALCREDADPRSAEGRRGFGSDDGNVSLPSPGTGSWVARLDAPSVRLSATVLEGSDDATLARGAGHIEETAFPGQPGNIGIAGHRDTTFRAVRNLHTGDPLELTTSDHIYRYFDHEDVYSRARRRLRARSRRPSHADARDLLSLYIHRSRAAPVHHSGGAGRPGGAHRHVTADRKVGLRCPTCPASHSWFCPPWYSDHDHA